MFPLIAMAAKALMPMITKMAGSLLSGGFSSMFSKLTDVAEMVKNVASEATKRSEGLKEKAKETATAAERVTQQATEFLKAPGGQQAPAPAFNLF